MQVRLQSKENRQRGPVVVIREVVADHGIRGLWRGTIPAAVPALLCTPIWISNDPRWNVECCLTLVVNRQTLCCVRLCMSL